MKAWTYAGFKKRLRQLNPQLYEDYQTRQGNFSSRLSSEPFFKEFILPFQVPVNLKYKEPLFVFDDAIDFKFLLSCLACSFSSTYEFKYPSFMDCYSFSDLLPELHITVESNGKTLKKGVHTLWEPQLTRLFDIYLSEALQYYLLDLDAPKLNSIRKMHKERLDYFEKIIKECEQKMNRSEILFELKNRNEIMGRNPKKEAIF